MIAKIKVKERQDRPGEMSNEIGGYKPDSSAPVQQKQSIAPKPQANASAPWKRNAA